MGEIHPSIVVVMDSDRPDLMPYVKTHRGRRYVSYEMPTLEKMEPTQANLVRIIDCCEHLVRKGFLHNDLHQGNVMMHKGRAVIIDLSAGKEQGVLGGRARIDRVPHFAI